MSDYERIAKAIDFLVENAESQPSLKKIAASVHLSPFHFQRLFSNWVGVTPKRFLQTLTVERAKELLALSEPLEVVSDAVGLSTSSRLHDHFIQLEAVTPGQYKSAGLGLEILFGIHQTIFGDCLIAATDRGICKLAFVDAGDIDEELSTLQRQWPEANISEDQQSTAEMAKVIFHSDQNANRPISLQVRGTNFQVMVWRALMQIPQGRLQSYSGIAEAIGKPSATRAVGTAIGANPIAFLIPCHRVVRQSGAIGGYRWGETRKHAIHAWESAQTS
jgi:AraC family transcriptional regulator, regulatory protein of adaptative response / methylated-DNA-[protein]-cysteine methyltransferase